RQIESGLQTFCPTRLDELAHDITVAGAPRTLGDGVTGGARRPEAEAVVMLCGENKCASSSLPCGARPLAGVERRRRENRWRLATVAPLAIGECVHTEMEKECQLISLPRELRRRRARTKRWRDS